MKRKASVILLVVSILLMQFVGVINAFGATLKIISVAAGWKHTVALREDGTVFAWGNNDLGQCTIPPGLSNAKAIAAGWDHTIALKADGNVVAWGDNTYEQSTIPAGLVTVKGIAAGSHHTVALKTNGTVVAWGDNKDGQCTIPSGLTNVKSIAAGSRHTVALRENGTVVAWGNNGDGQCTVPAGLTNIEAISAGNEHTVAYKKDGSIISWGDNGFGQCTIPTSPYQYNVPDPGDNLKLPIEELAKVTDKNTAVNAISTAAKVLTAEQKKSATGIDKLTVFAESAIARSVVKSVSNPVINITSDTVKNMDNQAHETKTAAENVLLENGVTPLREIKTTGIIKTDSAQKVTIKIDNTAASSNLDEVKVETPYIGTVFTKANIKADTASKPVSMTVEETSTKKVSVKFDTDATTIVRVSFPGITGDANYKAVLDEKGNPVGGKYNPAENTLEAKIKTSGIYNVAENKKDFDDIKNKAAEMQEAIKQLASKGIINGKSPKNYAPDDRISRAEVAALIVRSLSKLDANEDGKFTDVSRSNWFFGTAGSSKKYGIITGYPDNTFRGDVYIPKDQITAVTARVLKIEMKYKVPDNKDSYLNYADRNSLQTWSLPEVALATQANLVVKRIDGRFLPDSEMSRGDAAILLKRMFDKYGNFISVIGRSDKRI